LPGENEPVSEYIFCRKRLLWGEGLVQTSTIFTPLSLARDVPIRTELRKHEDWDWVIRACHRKDTGLEFVDRAEPLVIWHIEGERERMSTMPPDWRDSMEWLQSIRELMTPRSYASFILTHLSMTARQAGEKKALPHLLGEALSQGRPGLSDFLILCRNLLLPRKLLRRTARSYSFLQKRLMKGQMIRLRNRMRSRETRQG
jgi:hypothetical protein